MKKIISPLDNGNFKVTRTAIDSFSACVVLVGLAAILYVVKVMQPDTVVGTLLYCSAGIFAVVSGLIGLRKRESIEVSKTELRQFEKD